ncbi:MAG: SSI family serine proteinase inhibitor [Stackebrandtia sp.]
MSKKTIRLAGLTLATIALGFAPLAAQADEAKPPQGSFDLTVEKGGDVFAEATLSCSPNGGTHSDAKAACKQLKAANGQVGDIPAEDGPCTLEYDPVVLVSDGTWKGEDVTYSEEFSNLCVGLLSTGSVLFDI